METVIKREGRCSGARTLQGKEGGIAISHWSTCQILTCHVRCSLRGHAKKSKGKSIIFNARVFVEQFYTADYYLGGGLQFIPWHL